MNKEEFLRKFIHSYTTGDENFFMQHLTDDICWEIVGEKYFGGKIEFKEAIDQMQEMPAMEIEVKNVILDDQYGIVEGIVASRNRLGQKKEFGFCDIYKFAEGEELKISNITSYVVDISRYLQYKEEK